MATAGPWTSISPRLPPPLLNALTSELSFPRMTPVQATAIPPILSGKDVSVDAETGSGKTLSYLVPIAHTLLFRLKTPANAAIRALILLPTRELAHQVQLVASRLFGALPTTLKVASLIGGAGGDAAPDPAILSDMRVVVATPGRLAAALLAGTINVSTLEILILDEADRLLDMGFSVTLTDILTRLPRQRRTGIYSATQTKEVEALARAGLRNPVRVAIRVRIAGKEGIIASEERRRTPASLTCEYAIVTHRDRLIHFTRLLGRHAQLKFIVYFMTCACVDYVKRLPLNAMIRLLGGDEEGSKRSFFSLHGKMSQAKRERALANFAASGNGVLMCTDVAARGIDIPDVDWVVQFDAPQDPDAYIHRVGRTARLGREGHALIYLAPSEDAYVDFLQVRRCPVNHFVGDGKKEEEEILRTEKVRTLVKEATLADRAILEASEAAFLSYMRAYKEHKCRYLLKLEDIDIDSVADSFCLLRLPRFHEFKKLKKKITPRNLDGVNIREISFRDKVREKKRQADIKLAIENRAQRREALQAKSKKKVKKKKQKKGIEMNDKMNVARGRKREAADEAEEPDDFSDIAAKLRRVKRGKMSQSTFDDVTGISGELHEP
eukprot:GFKZ01009197.1.p1 GENE.GFKZ01009197.1~~GFKZ01009197.1.p1  ORF type:complete len:610 (+),score=84.83 GFKZ01009197.1:158-1987(+)